MPKMPHFGAVVVTVGKQQAAISVKGMMIRYFLLSALLLLGPFQSEAFSNSAISARSTLVNRGTAALKQSTELFALLDPSIILSTDILMEESIHAAFSIATFFPQPFWVLLTLLPNASLTKKIMGGMGTQN